jgi:2-phosphosulfolactate phosphatase
MNKSRPRVDVCLTPALFYQFDVSDSIVVVIDILRATSSMCVAFQYGAKSLVPVMTTEESFSYKEKGYLIGAERQGTQLEGFDLGNSPFSYMEDKIAGRNIALTTTNGTRAMNIAKDAYLVVAGSFLNLSVLTEWLIQQDKNVVCLCAGWKDTFNLEDTLFAGALSQQLLRHFQLSNHRDAVLAAMQLYDSAKTDLYAFLTPSSHRNRLAELKIDEDVIYCLTPDQTRVVPVLKNGVLFNYTDVLVNAQ